MTDITINVSDGAPTKPAAAGEVKRDTALGGGPAAGGKKQLAGFTGQIEAMGQVIDVKNGKAVMGKKALFIDAQGRAMAKGPKGEVVIVGKVTPGKLVASVTKKGAPAA